jgi:flagellar hook-basal body complex protein FliE
VSLAPINLPQIAGIASPETSPATKKADLGNAFSNVLDEARQAEARSTEASEKFAAGDPSIGIHEVVIESEKASIAVRYVTTLKNKALDAYRDLMNTQV